MRKYCCLLYVVCLLASSVVVSCAPKAEPAPTGRPEPPQELLEAVPFAIPKAGPTEAWREARRIFYIAYMLQLQGALEEAIVQYRHSIDAYPTAEAYTFLGWTFGWMGRYDDAIREAQRAIAIDPEYGNPYNDIGVYLTKLGKLDEAILWLKRAMQAKRYANPEYPWLNLGNIWVLKGRWGKALSSYEEIWRLAPDHPIPVVPAVEAALFLPPEQTRNPGTPADQRAVKEAITRYFDARNSYDADGLKDCSDPPSTEVTMAVLLRLAAAKHVGVTVRVHDIRVLHMEGGTAIVEATVSVFAKPDAVWYLLRQTDGMWRVVIPLLGESQGRPATCVSVEC